MDFEQFYQDKYPAGVPREVDLNKYKSMVDVFEQSVKNLPTVQLSVLLVQLSLTVTSTPRAATLQPGCKTRQT